MNPASDRLLEELHLDLGRPVSPDLRDWVQQSLQRGRSTQVEYDIASCHYFITITPILNENYANLYWTNITERKHAEIALRESESRFRILADSAPVLIWMNGPEGAEFVNRAYLNFLGVSQQIDVAKFDWTQYVHPEDRDRYITAYLASFKERALFDQEFRFLRHDGRYRWMRSVGTPRLSSTGDLLGYVGATYDITDIKEVQERSNVGMSS